MTLGLFPLNLVLFPGVRIPLHVFEPRYRTLISECLDRGSDLGVNLVEKGRMEMVGCGARVVTVTERYPDGRMDVIVEGTFRYRVLSVVEDTHPYVVGEVEQLEDESITTDPALLAECATLHNQVIELIYDSPEGIVDVSNLGQKSAAFLMAPKSGLGNMQKQALLEMNSENDRLVLLRTHLREIIPVIRKAETVQRIIRSDGYLKALE